MSEVEHHMKWQQMMGKLPVDQIFVEEALRKIHAGESAAEKYPNGAPSPKDTYDLAVALQKESSVIQ